VSTGAAAPFVAPVSTARLVAVLGGVALVCGVLVVSAYQLALPRIEENKRIAVERAIAAVYPQVATRRSFVVTAAGLAPTADPAAPGLRAHAVYDRDGRFLGIAAEGAARGYQDVLRLLYAWSPDCQCITAIHVLRNNDTPGIGDKITRDAAFLENFRALDARPNAAGDALAHPIATVRHGTKTDPWQIDAITGATVTSRAVGRALNDSAQQVVPKVAARLAELQRPEPPR
jgi:electron transport complex protein RnfG